MNAKETGHDLAIRILLRGRTEQLAILFLPPSDLPVALALQALDTLADFDKTLALLGCPAELLTIPQNPNYGRIHLVALHGVRLAS